MAQIQSSFQIADAELTNVSQEILHAQQTTEDVQNDRHMYGTVLYRQTWQKRQERKRTFNSILLMCFNLKFNRTYDSYINKNSSVLATRKD